MKPWIPVFCISILMVLIAYTNLTPHTYLTGWDNVESELSLPVNLSRAFFGVWQEYQGVGLVEGLAHPADLIHTLTLLLLSVFFPVHMLRFLWTMLMLYIGTVGAYLLIYLLTQKNPLYGFLGSMFYLLNSATVQQFFLPYEAFSAQFACLPWLFWSLVTVYKTPSRKNFLIFAGITLLATPQAYVETVFFVFVVSATIFLLVLWIFHRSKKTLILLCQIACVFLCINAFWLLPFTYFFLDNGSVATKAKANQMATPDILLKNKEFGYLNTVISLEGFLFNGVNQTMDNRIDYLFVPWRNYLRSPWNTALAYLFFMIICIGLWQSVKTKNSVLVGFGVLFLFTFTTLTISTPPFSWFQDFFRFLFPFLSQAYRFPFTKFSLLAGLLYAIFFALGIRQLLKHRFEAVQVLAGGIWCSVLIIHVFPVFTGHLFYNREQVAIPSDYVHLFAFFTKQNPTARIANFPQVSYWGWEDYTWHYGGSGFLWYGISQPILDRAFDPWSSYNENYYWELSHAIAAQHASELLSIFKKYTVTWIIYDHSISQIQNPQLLKQTNQEALLTSLPGIKKAATFGPIDVFNLSLDSSSSSSFVFAAHKLPTVNSTAWNDEDTPYQELGDYQVNSSPSVFYPFVSLFTNQPSAFSLSQHNDSLLLQTSVPHQFALQSPTSPPQSVQKQFSVHISFSDTSPFADNLILFPIRFLSSDPITTLTVSLKKLSSVYQSAVFHPNTAVSRVVSCDNFRRGPIHALGADTSLELFASNASSCIAFSAAYLSHDTGYALFVQSAHHAGKPLHLWVEDPVLHTTLLDTYLPQSSQSLQSAFILPPLEKFATSYTIHIENQSIGQDISVNSLGEISLYPLPYNYLKHLRLGTPPTHPSPPTSLAFSHPNPSLYKGLLPPHTHTLILSQAYDAGWNAYRIDANNPLSQVFPFLFGDKLPAHVLVNSWENGWITAAQNSPQYIVLLFLPQYLEYLGFVFMGIAFLWVVVRKQ